MRKLFLLLSIASALMVFAAGFGTLWLSNNEVDNAKTEAAATEAKSVAIGIAAQISLLNKTLDKMAQDPDVIQALIIGNRDIMQSAAQKLEKHLPDVLKIRLLSPSTTEIDETFKPRMGYADLELVKETLKTNQFPSVQGDKDIDRHLAIARGIQLNGKTIGVILASLDESIIQKSLFLSGFKSGYIELKQGSLLLGSIGQRVGGNATETKQINVPNTDWAIHYQFPATWYISNISLQTGMILVPGFIILLVMYTGLQWLSNILSQDLESLMKAFKNIMTNTPQSNFPVELAEMNAAISSLLQFKRVLDYGERDIMDTDEAPNIIVSDDEDFSLDGLFDENDEFKL